MHLHRLKFGWCSKNYSFYRPCTPFSWPLLDCFPNFLPIHTYRYSAKHKAQCNDWTKQSLGSPDRLFACTVFWLFLELFSLFPARRKRQPHYSSAQRKSHCIQQNLWRRLRKARARRQQQVGWLLASSCLANNHNQHISELDLSCKNL